MAIQLLQMLFLRPPPRRQPSALSATFMCVHSRRKDLTLVRTRGIDGRGQSLTASALLRTTSNSHGEIAISYLTDNHRVTNQILVLGCCDQPSIRTNHLSQSSTEVPS